MDPINFEDASRRGSLPGTGIDMHYSGITKVREVGRIHLAWEKRKKEKILENRGMWGKHVE